MITICKTCGIEKKHYAKGLCRKCYRKNDYTNNTEKIKGYGKLYRENNKQTIKENYRKYMLNNPDIIKKNNKTFREKNPGYIKTYDKNHLEERSEYHKQRYKKNPEYQKMNSKRYVKEHPEVMKKNLIKFNNKNPTYHNDNNKKRRKVDINFKLKCLLSTSIILAIKNGYKSARTIELLGCSIDFFRQHIESQWLPGMTWDNWTTDGWHIDHITPKFKFDLSKPEEQQKCFHYTNQRPLWCTTEIALQNGCNEIGNLNRAKA